MEPADKILIYNQSCESFETLVQRLKRTSAQKLGVEPRYAAGVWKKLFLTTLHRIAKEQPSMARLTAVEALNIVGCFSSPTSLYPKTATARYVLKKLHVMNARSLRGNASPRQGFHPIDLRRWKAEAMRVEQETSLCDKAIASALWKRCGGKGSQIPDRVLDEIRTKRTPNSRAIAFVAGLTGTEAHILRIVMHRQRTLNNL